MNHVSAACTSQSSAAWCSPRQSGARCGCESIDEIYQDRFAHGPGMLLPASRTVRLRSHAVWQSYHRGRIGFYLGGKKLAGVRALHCEELHGSPHRGGQLRLRGRSNPPSRYSKLVAMDLVPRFSYLSSPQAAVSGSRPPGPSEEHHCKCHGRHQNSVCFTPL